MSQVFASHLLANLVRQGVTSYFLAPGSRSQSLAIAISQLEAAGKAKAVVRLDERSLGFTALGHALASGSPAALVVTSGTAVANLHPAVLEAHHSSVPLLILSADRPASLRGKGANQTTNQVGLFGSAAVCIDVPIGATPQDAQELGTKVARHFQARSGPLQLNLQFAPPLSASEPNAAELAKTMQV
ncbi:MAG: thiamine pyrophosphate-binding protein, partial [Aquiluna sp.]